MSDNTLGDGSNDRPQSFPPAERTKNRPNTLPEQTPGWLGGSNGLLIGLGLGLGLALLLSRIGAKPAADPAIAPEATEQVASASVTTALAETATIPEVVSASGTVQASDLLSISPRASGLQIQQVLVREGDRVSAGQLLARLDDSVIRSQIEQAEAQVAQAQAQVAQAQAKVNQDEAALAEARDQFGRYERLFAQGAISEEELATRRTQVVTAEQTVGTAIAGIDSAAATVRSSQADVTRLNTQLGQTEVLAPDSGVIAEKSATIGDIAAPGTPMFKLISGNQLELAVKVPATSIAEIKPGDLVAITTSANKNIQLQGQVSSIAPTRGENTLATVSVDLPGSDLLSPGMFLAAAISTSTREGIVVPAAALVLQPGGGKVVYTLTDDGGQARKVKAQPVKVGDRIPATGNTPDRIEITSGLVANTSVVIEGASYLQQGDIVDVVDVAASDFVSSGAAADTVSKEGSN